MARYFRFQTCIESGVVQSISWHIFNTELRIVESVVEVTAPDDQIIEWMSVQNVTLTELTAEEAIAWRMENPPVDVRNAMKYLADTDHKMTVDYYAQMSAADQQTISTSRQSAREIVRIYKAGI